MRVATAALVAISPCSVRSRALHESMVGITVFFGH